jgi:hypothetical protein
VLLANTSKTEKIDEKESHRAKFSLHRRAHENELRAIVEKKRENYRQEIGAI